MGSCMRKTRVSCRKLVRTMNLQASTIWAPALLTTRRAINKQGPRRGVDCEFIPTQGTSIYRQDTSEGARAVPLSGEPHMVFEASWRSKRALQPLWMWWRTSYKIAVGFSHVNVSKVCSTRVITTHPLKYLTFSCISPEELCHLCTYLQSYLLRPQSPQRACLP